MKKSIFLILFAISIAFPSLAQAQDVLPLAVDSDCLSVETIYARGSGDQKNGDWWGRFQDSLNERLKPAGITSHFYELGTEAYGNAIYPAVNVGNVFNGNATGAAISAGKSFDYGNSVAAGKVELKKYLTLRLERCPTARVVIGGYSQGAQVVREAVSELPEDITKNIDFLALFGDPKLHLPEGEGVVPPACRGKEFSSWRRVVENCETDSGSLGAQKPFLPTALVNKTGLWCYAHDFVCGSTRNPFDTGGHMRYGSDGQAIDLATQEAANKLTARFANEQAAKIDLAYRLGYGFNGEDVAFVIDLSKSMEDRLPAIKQLVTTTAAKLKEKNGRFANVIYYWPDDEPDGAVHLPYAGSIEFERDYDEALMYFNLITAMPYTKQAPTLTALITALDSLKWRPGAMKSILLFTDESTIASPDYRGRPLSYAINRSVEIDPVNIFPVVPVGVKDAYEELAAKTQGSVTTYEGDVLGAGDRAYEKTVNRPVVLFKNLEYAATPGEELTFDASDSYAVNAAITKFEWDFNGDNVFEQTTTEPRVSYTYDSNFEGLVQLKVTTSDGDVSNGTAKVRIGARQSPVVPPPPAEVEVIPMADRTKVTLSWSGDHDMVSMKWVVSVDGVAIATLDRNTSSIEITDLDRTADITLAIAGMSEANLIGEYSTAVLKKPVQDTLTCATGNMFADLLCKTSEQIKALIAAQQQQLRALQGR